MIFVLYLLLLLTLLLSAFPAVDGIDCFPSIAGIIADNPLLLA
jgi:hypothetical protein